MHFDGRPIDAIAAAEARGFLFAAPLALRLHVPLVPLRKPGKLPYRTYSLKYELEYGEAELQMHADGIAEGGRVLLVDDVLATGGTMEAGRPPRDAGRRQSRRLARSWWSCPS